MSEFSESYHLRTTSSEDAVALLKRAGLGGFVFPAENGWVAFVAEGELFQPNLRLIAENKLTLLHYVLAEDHGWSFALFSSDKLVSAYGVSWEDGIRADDSKYSVNAFRSCLGAATADELTKINHIFRLNSIDDVFENEPSHAFAEAVGLTRFEWFAYGYVTRDIQKNDDLYPGIIAVS